jgi:hypothetical protein
MAEVPRKYGIIAPQAQFHRQQGFSTNYYQLINGSAICTLTDLRISFRFQAKGFVLLYKCMLCVGGVTIACALFATLDVRFEILKFSSVLL